jgi:hypothetical protein
MFRASVRLGPARKAVQSAPALMRGPASLACALARLSCALTTLGAVATIALLCALAPAPAAAAIKTPFSPPGLGPSPLVSWWLPDLPSARWQYDWSDSVYNPAPGTVENVTVQSHTATGFTLAWTGVPPSGSPVSDQGTVDFQYADFGIVNTDWSSTPPPADEPILCASASNCANSLSSAYYNVIWGARDPVLAEPLLAGTSWDATGGAQNDVLSVNTYLGEREVSVPAFPHPVMAAVIRSTISQAGALGDPYGSGERTTWWVYGVGPAKVVFQHAGGSQAPVTDVVLQSTSLKPLPPPPAANYFPLRQGLSGLYRMTNSRFLRRPEIERVTVAKVVNGSAELTVNSVSGPMRVKGAYVFTTRLLEGVSNISGSAAAATRLKFPKLARGLHFITPVDLMTYGFNPLLPAYPLAGDSWGSGDRRDLRVYGVRGTTRIIGVRRVRVPAGTFSALEVRSVLTQPGHPYGSGVRLMWFAPGRGLVQLIFRQRDHTVTRVVALR